MGFLVGSTGGDVSVAFSQNVSSAKALTVYQGSQEGSRSAGISQSRSEDPYK